MWACCGSNKTKPANSTQKDCAAIIIVATRYLMHSRVAIANKMCISSRQYLFGHDDDTRSGKVLGGTVDSIIGIDGIISSPVYLQEEVKS